MCRGKQIRGLKLNSVLFMNCYHVRLFCYLGNQNELCNMRSIFWWYIYINIFFFIENVNIGINWVFSTNVVAPGREFSGYCSATSRRCCWRRNGLWMEWWWWFTWVESTKGIDWSHRGSDCRFSACVVHAKHNECWTARNAQTFGARKHDYVISHQCLVLETVHYVLHFMVGDLEF